MTTETETTTANEKQKPDFYIFENAGKGEKKGGKPAGAVFLHKKGKGFNILIAGKRYSAFPPKAKPAAQPEATQGESA